MTKRITQKDIAEKLGITKGTVSMALRDDRRISQATRDRVHSLAADLGYRLDPALSIAAKIRWSSHTNRNDPVIAYLVDSRMKNLRMQRRFIPSALQRANEMGYHLEEFDLRVYADYHQAGRVLWTRGIRGLLVPQFEKSSSLNILNLEVERFSIVCIERGWNRLPFNLVGPDHYRATRKVWREVISRGYERIGGAIFRHVPLALDDATRWGASMISQEEWIPSDSRIPLLGCDPCDCDDFFRWLDRYTPDAVITLTCRQAKWLLDAGYRIPEDIACAALLCQKRFLPFISGTVTAFEESGVRAVDLLLSMLYHNEYGIPRTQQEVYFSPVWREGNSLPSKSQPHVNRLDKSATEPLFPR